MRLDPVRSMSDSRELQVHRPGTLSLSGVYLAIGAFDGVHLGHQALLETLVGEARRADLPAVVYTFDPPPRVVLGGAEQITTLAQKLDRLALSGVEHVIVARFDRAYAARAPDDFLAEIAQLSPRKVWVGADFRFGRNRAGSPALFGRRFPVALLPEVGCGAGERISSSRIRVLLAEGQWLEAHRLLGWSENRPLSGLPLPTVGSRL